MLHSNIVFQSYTPILLILLLGIVFNFLQMLNWTLILRGLDISIPLKETLKNFPKTFLPRYIPGSIWGYLSRGEWLLADFNVSHKMNIYSSLIEVIIPLSASLFLLTGFFVDESFLLFFLLAVLILIGLWLLFEFSRRKVFPRLGFSDGNYFFSLRRWLLGNLIFSVNWILMGLMTVLLISVFSDSLSQSSLNSLQNVWNATLAYCAAWLGGFLVLFVPAGMGVREVLFRLILVQFMGISSETALLVAVASRFVSLLSEGFWLIIGMLIKD
jgi:membrane protease YdiL (CAAX protease family)